MRLIGSNNGVRGEFAMRFSTIGLALLLGFAGVLTPAEAGRRKEGFVSRTYRGDEGEGKYLVFVPHKYDAKKPSPVILFLHGAGQTGTDGKAPATVGLGAAIKTREKTFPFIVVFPQSQQQTWQAGSKDADRALAILAEVEKSYKTDRRRVYLTGLSMGGFGTWSLAAAYPERWAAIVPICGGGNPKDAAIIKDIPCWCFHGAADKAVPVKKARMMIDALKAVGGTPRYAEFQGVDHNSWDRAYGSAPLYQWLLQQKK
jgi:predicted peptidase